MVPPLWFYLKGPLVGVAQVRSGHHTRESQFHIIGFAHYRSQLCRGILPL